jgi:hypothetical protein
MLLATLQDDIQHNRREFDMRDNDLAGNTCRDLPPALPGPPSRATASSTARPTLAPPPRRAPAGASSPT